MYYELMMHFNVIPIFTTRKQNTSIISKWGKPTKELIIRK
jgi:hypothetical protein